ncbi:MAG: formylglycine-generating enzyme family protein [Symploca sp. SIO3E6]|nr:formylglycine-generating enzyme family protein [Caldora sp. SIO3E6]
MTERFQLAANILLSRRLKNLVRIDDHVEIDLSYITCAEYQLFIDEKRQAGVNRQPDHWQDYGFPLGDARKPITGVRASDAEEFCNWLTQQQSTLGFRYRLPTLAEAKENPAKELQIGCWCEDRGEKVIAGIEATQWQDWYSNFVEVTTLNCDLNSDLCAILNSVLNLDIYRVINLDLNRDLNDILNGVLNFNLYRVLNLDNLNHDFHRVLNHDFHRVLNHDFHCVLNRDFHRVLNRNFYRVLNHNFYRVLKHNFYSFLKHDSYRNLYKRVTADEASDFLILYFPLLFFILIYYVLSVTYKAASQNQRTLKEINLSHRESKAISHKYQQKIDEIYPLYVYLVLLDERQAGRIPAWESIRLVRERGGID